MLKINIHEAKTHLSRYLANLEAGETILLCRRNVPIAEIRPLPRPSQDSRPIGLGRDSFQVPQAFFESLPEEDIKTFEGRGD